MERAKETPAEFRERMRSIGYLAGGRTRTTFVEYKTSDGDRVKETTDSSNNTITEHADDRVDVILRPDTVELKTLQ